MKDCKQERHEILGGNYLQYWRNLVLNRWCQYYDHEPCRKLNNHKENDVSQSSQN